MFKYISLSNLTNEVNIKNFYYLYTNTHNLTKSFKMKVVEQILTQFTQHNFISLPAFYYVTLLIRDYPSLLYSFVEYFNNNNLEDEKEQYSNFIQELIINFKPNQQQFLFLCKILNPLFFHTLYINNKDIKFSLKQKNKIKQHLDRDNILYFSLEERIEIENNFGFFWTLLLSFENIKTHPDFLNYYKSKVQLCTNDQINVILLRYSRTLDNDILFNIFDYTFNLFPNTKFYLENKTVAILKNVMIEYEKFKTQNQLNNF